MVGVVEEGREMSVAFVTIDHCLQPLLGFKMNGSLSVLFTGDRVFAVSDKTTSSIVLYCCVADGVISWRLGRL